MAHILRHLLTAETKRAHRGRWYVWAGGEKIPHQATMRGLWGWDVECSCGEWASHTGGATRSSVEDAFWDHRYAAQAEAERQGGEPRMSGTQPAQLTWRKVSTGNTVAIVGPRIYSSGYAEGHGWWLESWLMSDPARPTSHLTENGTAYFPTRKAARQAAAEHAAESQS